MKYIRTRCAGIVQEKTYGKRKFRSIEGRKFLEQTTKLAHDFLRNKKFGVPVRDCFDTQSILYDKDIQKEAAYHS